MEKSEGFYRLECRIKRRNRILPCVFLIDGTREPAMASIYDPRTRESLDHARIYGPRPLKTHAYNFAYIEGKDGRPLVEKRPSNRQEAEAFVSIIMQNAEPISRERYFLEIEEIIWPPERMREIPRRAKRPSVAYEDLGFQSPLAFEMLMGKRAAPPADSLGFMMLPSPASPPSGKPDVGRTKSERKLIIREMIRLMESMDLEDLREMLRFARLLLEE